MTHAFSFSERTHIQQIHTLFILFTNKVYIIFYTETTKVSTKIESLKLKNLQDWGIWVARHGYRLEGLHSCQKAQQLKTKTKSDARNKEQKLIKQEV